VRSDGKKRACQQWLVASLGCI